MTKLAKNKSKYHVIGLMSGTSLDGLDMAYCEFEKEETWSFKCLSFETVSYPQHLFDRLKIVTKHTAEELFAVDVELGRWFAKRVNSFIEKNNLQVDFIASHGHTVFHQPEKGFTLQIGNGNVLNNLTGLPVICDFRSKDVSLGGQGAPLVPIGDKLLFSDYDYCVNLGGIANISFDENNERVAFDVVPCNMVLNRLAEKVGKTFDRNGDLARSGKVQYDLLEQLDAWSYLKKSPPKSLGYEQVNKEVFPELDHDKFAIPDLLATYTYHISKQLVNVINRKATNVLLTGGGAHNEFLVQLLSKQLAGKAKVVVPDRQLVDFKEAIVFAFLGVLKARDEVNCLASVTGASQDSSGGVIYE